jgi:hypothetical protein
MPSYPLVILNILQFDHRNRWFAQQTSPIANSLHALRKIHVGFSPLTFRRRTFFSIPSKIYRFMNLAPWQWDDVSHERPTEVVFLGWFMDVHVELGSPKSSNQKNELRLKNLSPPIWKTSGNENLGLTFSIAMKINGKHHKKNGLSNARGGWWRMLIHFTQNKREFGVGDNPKKSTWNDFQLYV